MTPDDPALRVLNPVNVGARYPRFDNGVTETVFAIEVDHPSGRWDQIWVKRDSALADRVVAALAAAEAAPLDDCAERMKAYRARRENLARRKYNEGREQGLRDAAEAAPLDMHTQEADANGVFCREDGQRWPCETVRSAEAAPLDVERLRLRLRGIYGQTWTAYADSLDAILDEYAALRSPDTETAETEG